MRATFYRGLTQRNPKLKVFFKGWLHRLNALRREIGLPGFESIEETLDFGETGSIAEVPDIGADPDYDLSSSRRIAIMPHVTFIHGIANKPPKADLLRIWKNALASGPEPLPLGEIGISSSMVYWADLMYAAPEEDVSSYENALESTPAGVDAGGDIQPPTADTPEEALFFERMRRGMTQLSDEDLAADPPAEPHAPAGSLERVPLPWFLKRQIMNIFLRDVHHYLFNTRFAPPGHTPVPIQDTIRRRFVDELAQQVGNGPHIVVSHSMGTVIAYDNLKRVAECAGVDGLITLGCPLGFDEVQDKLQPGWSRSHGFPDEKLTGDWANFYDRLDPVCGFDPVLANDFEKAGSPAVRDAAIQNDGAWRHSATKYLRQPAVSRELRRMLGV